MSNNTTTISPDKRPEWDSLRKHHKDISQLHLKTLFSEDKQRFEKFHTSLPGILFDYSKHNITDETLASLMALAKACELEKHRESLYSGQKINTTNNRAVLHTALRGSCSPELEVDGEKISGFVQSTLGQIEALSSKIRHNKEITDIINIGIGGSDLGPRMVYKALKPLADGPTVHYVSNIDGSTLYHRLKALKPQNTLFVIASKTFSTLETLTNAQTAKDWLLKDLSADALYDHLIAVTAAPQEAEKFGVRKDHILPMRDWIGGRYSLWSSIGVSIAISNGFKSFLELLRGAKEIDDHFLNAPLEKNIPVIMAMLGVWYRNFWDYSAQAILPYSHDLRDFPTYLQQLDMESNGKSVTKDGQMVSISTGPVIFGEAGTNAQHAFMQLLHQSQNIIPADFILVASPQHPLGDHHEKLLANALAQSKALMEGQDNIDEPYRFFSGNRPSSSLILDKLDPFHLGMLLALYEHKIFVQGVIWNINSFDQWGVELGKINAKTIIKAFENKEKNIKSDSSTTGLFDHLNQKFIES